jgi:hypothetical protein
VSAPKFGIPCLACKQRIKPFGPRHPVRDEQRTVLGYVHPGCHKAKV